MTTRASLLGLLLVLPACGFTNEYVGNQAIESPNAKEVNSRARRPRDVGNPDAGPRKPRRGRLPLRKRARVGDVRRLRV